MQNLHLKLTSKYPQYHNWHQTKHHNKIHWGVLAVFTLLIFGTISRWTPISFAADTVPPTTPTSLTVAAISPSQINLSWTASTDDVGVTGYKIYRCVGSGCAPTTQIVTSAVNSYSNTGLTASTAYTYAVSAYDAAGNESAKSAQVSAITQPQTLTGDSWNDLINTYNVYSELNIPKPGYLQSYIDPVFGTKITRITDYTTNGVRVHSYAKQNPWNANNSYLILVESINSNWHLYDGQTYQWIKNLDIRWGGKAADPVWHPTDPNIIFYQYGNEFRKIDVTTNQSTTLRTFPSYSYISSMGEGTTITSNGRISLAGLDSSKNVKAIFVYNVFTDQLGSPIDLSGNNGIFDWVGISRSGQYVVTMWGACSGSCGPYDGVKLYRVNSDLSLTYLSNIYNLNKHSDFSVDSDDSDVLVVDDKSSFDHIIKINLSNQTQTEIQTNAGWFNANHISGRCINKPGWAILSTYSASPGDPWIPFRDEVYALKLDGSGEVRRIAHTHSQSYLNNNTAISYWATPRATANKDCTQIMFDSNWRDLSNGGDNVDVYVVDVSTSSAPPDTTPPSAPTGFTANAILSAQINLSWTASTDNIGVTGYKIFRNGSQIATSTTTSYSDTGLTASTTYTYAISAYDAVGNESSKSTSASATTQAQTGNTYYVATTGIDNTACGSTTNPCATVQYVLNIKVSAGDTIKVKAGTYNLNTIYITDPVKHVNLTLTADDPNNKPLLKFSSSSVGSIRIGYLEGNNPNNDVSVPGVTISYLKIESAPSRITTYHIGIQVDRESNPVTIDHNEIYNDFIGIGINTGKNVIVSNNKIYAMGVPNPPPGAGQGVGIATYNFLGRNTIASGWNEKIYIYNNEVYDVSEDGFINVNSNYKYIEVAYNNFHDNYEDGLDWKDTQYVRIHHNKLYNNQDNGIGSNNSYPSTDFEIWDNEIYNNGWYGIIIQGGSNDQKNWKIWNNLIYGNAKKPEPWGADGVVLNGSGHEFYHNVVYNNITPAGESNAGIRGNGIIKNNIFYNNASSGGQYQNGNIAAGGTIDHNYVYPTSPGITGTNAITTSNPILTDPANGDFTLKSGSPLIDKGVDVGITTDFAGNARPQGAGYDLGAYEYGDTPPPDNTAPSTPTNLTATAISSTQINLSWSASTDNVGVAGYKIYRCAGSACTPTTQIATSATNSYSSTGLTASTAYTYAVSAYDAAGNESGKSSSMSATTLSQFKQADFNKDGIVNQLDFDILKQDWSRTDKPVSDLNQDGVVDSRDLGIMMSQWNK